MHQITLNEFHKIWEQLTPSIDGMRDKSILITGATGLIGSYLIDFLIWANSEHKLNLEIFATSTSTDKLVRRFGNPPNMHFIECDLSQPWQTDEKFDFIIHGASSTNPQHLNHSPVSVMQTNIVGGISLLEIARNNNARFLFLSSGEIYGNTHDTAVSETHLGIIDTLIPRSCYPESKRAVETLCISYATQYNLHVNIARPCYIYGPTIIPDNNRIDAEFLRCTKNKSDIILKSPGHQRRTYCYVADATSGILYILLHGQNMHAYNIANPESVTTIRGYADTIARLAGIKVRAPDTPTDAIYSNSMLDASKLISLGWRPLYNLETGLRHTLKITQDN